MKKVMRAVISEYQSAFVEGRFILDGVIILNELIEDAKCKKKDCFLFKIDFAKAYDSVDWEFLDKMLDGMNFSPTWRNWIFGCLSSASSNVIVNGSPSGEFQLGRGPRQGDPLSPFLFLVVAEGLHIVAERAIQRGLLEPVAVGNREVQISHLQYADDTMFVAPVKRENVWAFKCILKLFEILSGLAVNFHKSSVMGVGIDLATCNMLAGILNCQVGNLPSNYLGIKIGARQRGIADWSYLSLKVKKKISEWESRKLSFGGRLTLVRSVLSAIPIYQLSFSLIPKAILAEIKSVMSTADSWRWKANPNGIYSSKSAYKILSLAGQRRIDADVEKAVAVIWKAPAPFKALTTAWKILRSSPDVR